MSMLGKNNKSLIGNQLDSSSRNLLQAATGSAADEVEKVVSSPFLYARLRARIGVERERRAEKEHWTMFFAVMRRAVPAMCLIAAFSFALLWFVKIASPGSDSIVNFNDRALLDARDAGIEQAIFLERKPLSSDEILNTILEQDE